MGRGRAKAKQTKVARELKYSSPGLDADALQRELAGISAKEPDEPQDEYEDDYSYSYEYEDDYRR